MILTGEPSENPGAEINPETVKKFIQRAANFETEIQGFLTEEAENFFKNLILLFPDFCPRCEYRHPSKLWVRTKEDFFQCDKCGYLLLEKDLFPPVIE